MVLLDKEITNSLFDEFFSVREREFLVFPHSVEIGRITHFWQKFRESDVFTKELI